MLIDFNKIKNGNKREFRILFNFYYPKIKAHGCRFVKEEIAEDLCQDLFMELWIGRQQIDPINVHSFLYRSIQNKCLNHLKHINVKQNYASQIQLAYERIDHSNGEQLNQVWHDITKHSFKERIEDALTSLPPKCAEAFKMAYIDDMSNKEVAENMHISIRTAETHIHKALTFMKRSFKPQK